MTEKCLELKEIKKSFSKEETVLKEISLSIDKGEFITLLGSSGCGKTTTLRIIAGLETPDSGRVFLDGRDVTGLAPEARDVNTVFQNYALFPHMTVADNIGYGLKLKKTPKAEIKKRVSEMLDLVQLPGFEKRKPSELSGGQRQRVALARTLCHKKPLLVLDDPFSALDKSTEKEVFANVRAMTRDSIVLLLSHRLYLFPQMDQIIWMDEGKTTVGTHEELLQKVSAYAALFTTQEGEDSHEA